MRDDLHRQLRELDVDLRLGALATAPPTEPGHAGAFTVRSSRGDITAGIWFRCHGVRFGAGYLTAGLAAARTPQGQVRVTDRLTDEGFDRVYALGDVTDIAEEKRAGYAMQHAEVVARNIISPVRGERPEALNRPHDPAAVRRSTQ